MLLNRHRKIRQQDDQQVVKQQPAETPVVDKKPQPAENIIDEQPVVTEQQQPAEKTSVKRGRRKKVDADE